MNTKEYFDDNHYETDMLRVEDEVDPHDTVSGPLDDRQYEESDFVVDPELSSTNL